MHLQELHKRCLRKYFEAEMNQTCPVHGFRRLGTINVLNVRIVDKGNVTEGSQGVPELVQEYERRLARQRQRMLEEDDDPEDL
jgi:hypothetical protein